MPKGNGVLGGVGAAYEIGTTKIRHYIDFRCDFRPFPELGLSLHQFLGKDEGILRQRGYSPFHDYASIFDVIPV